jgi:Flp pilus assembly protein TadG
MMMRSKFAALAPRALKAHYARLIADRSGTSLVEFAVLLPLMLVMYFGSIQITDAISADRQVTLVASTVAEITSQYTTVSSTDVSNILSASSAVLAPFPIANASVTLSSVLIDSTGKATIDWSSSLNGTQRASGTVVTSLIPAGLLVANTSVIWGEATYSYKPVIGWVITGTVPMYDQIFLRPRQSNNVVHS